MQFSTIAALVIAAPFISAVTITTVTTGGDNPYSTYPAVPHTASINGLADPIYDSLPSCAQSCFTESTASTPCPYWDTGCLCVMSVFDDPIAECIANQCQGNDVSSATSLAVSACSSAGVWSPYWLINPTLTASLEAAAQTTN